MTSEDRHREVEDPLEATGVGRSIELRPGGHLGGSEPREAPVDADFPAFRRLTFFSVIGGLCPFFPGSTPQDGALEAVCTRMVAELEHSRGLDLTPEEIRLLSTWNEENRPAPTGGGPSWLRPLQQLLRRPFPRLAVQAGVQHSVETFERGYLLLHAAGLEMAELHPPDRTTARVEEVRAAIEATLAGTSGEPLRQAIALVFQKSAGLLARAADLLAGFLRRTGIPAGSGALTAEGELLGGLVDQIASALWEDREGLANLERSFEANLARQRGLSV